MRNRLLFIFIVFTMLYSMPIYANDEVLDNEDPFSAEIDEDPFETEEDPFEDSNETVIEKKESIDSFLNDFTFAYSHKAAYSTHDGEVFVNRSQLRGEWEKLISPILFVKLDGSVSAYLSKDHISQADDKDLSFQGNLREAYLQAGFEKFSIRAGKQIIVWGETDGGIINDVISPRDNSELIFIDLKDSRISQYMILADIYSDFGEFQLFSIPLPETDKNPGKGTRYDLSVFPTGTVIVNQEPEIMDFETGFRWKHTFDKFDLSLMVADLYMNAPVYTQQGAAVYEQYDKYFFLGTGLSFTTSSFLFKLDAAYKKDYSLQAIDVTGYQGSKKDILDTGLSVEYDANGKYTMNFELNNSHIIDYSSSLSVQNENSTGFYYLFNKNFLNELLDFQYVFYYQFQESSAFHQVTLKYKYTDNIEIKCDYTHFNIIDETSTLWSYRNENRIGLEVKFYF